MPLYRIKQKRCPLIDLKTKDGSSFFKVLRVFKNTMDKYQHIVVVGL
jgi:hypothetical protein